MKANLVVAVLALVALAVSVVGVVKSDDWTGERTYTFQAASAPLATPEPQPAGSSPARFELAAPANATGADLRVLIDFTGQAIQGGTAAIRVKATAPDGNALAPVLGTLVVGQGGTSAQAELLLNFTWLAVPGEVQDTRVPDGHAWSAPLRLEITVERPADLPVATYAFTASLTGTFATYAVA